MLVSQPLQDKISYKKKKMIQKSTLATGIDKDS